MKKRLLGTLMTIAMLTTSLMGCSAGNTTSDNSQAHGTENMKGKTEVDFLVFRRKDGGKGRPGYCG